MKFSLTDHLSKHLEAASYRAVEEECERLEHIGGKGDEEPVPKKADGTPNHENSAACFAKTDLMLRKQQYLVI